MTENNAAPENITPASSTAMKPQTAAKKLGIFLPATPTDFQANALTHAQFRELQENPPQWLQDLRRHGPHPRPVVAQKLGVTIAALKRHGADKPLTTTEIQQLMASAPQWLQDARAALAEQRKHEATAQNNSHSTDSDPDDN